MKNKRVTVRDGSGRSFWLNPNHEPEKREAARIDWSFTVWQADRWEQLRSLPADLNPTDERDAELGPPARIDVYTGGGIDWAKIKVPKGLKVVDERLQTHGFGPDDGTVLEGKVSEVVTGRPVAGRVH